MRFSDSLATLHSSKQLEVSQRGLMGFPADSKQDRESQELLAAEIRELSETVIYHSPTTGLRLPVRQGFPANMLYYFLVGDYEEHDMQLIKRYVKEGARVLELGGGVGLTGSLLGKVSGRTVNVCEPNTKLHAQIEATFASNEVGLNLIKVAAVADSETVTEVSFNVCVDYWWSSLEPAENSEAVVVKARSLASLIKETQADTLLVDIEGYEVALLADTKSLQNIHTVLVELHTPSIGTAASSNIITALVRSGFSLVDMGGHTFVFSRPHATTFVPGPLTRWYS